MPIPCNGGGAYTWSGSVFPGTYKVRVKGNSYSSLPQDAFVAKTGLVINATTTGLVLDVLSLGVSGTNLQNGAQPTSTCSTADRGLILFDDDSKGYASNISGLTLDVKSTTISGTILQNGYSSLPQDAYVAIQKLVVP